MSLIELARTDKVNSDKLGDAVSLEWVDSQGAPPPTPTPTPSVATLGRIRAEVARPVGDAARPTPTPGIFYRDLKYKDLQVEKLFQVGARFI